MDTEDDDFENGIEEGDEDGGENGDKKKKGYKPPPYLITIPPDIRQRMLNLHVWASRERFLKRVRQSMRNFVASLKHSLKDKPPSEGWQITKLHLIEEHIQKVDKLIDDVEREVSLEIRGIPIWEKFLKNVKGIGPGHSGAIISQIGRIDRFTTISSLVKYCGWSVENGKPIKRASKAKCSYSPKMKQYFYHFAESAIKANDYYYQVYAEAKRDELSKHPEWEGRRAEKKKRIEGIPMHIHRRAKRKMIKRFISDLFIIWRDIEGLPPTTPYPIGILKHEGFVDPLKENPYYKRDES